MKVVRHSGVTCDPESRDIVAVDQQAIDMAQDVVRRHMPCIESTPSILEACLYTVSGLGLLYLSLSSIKYQLEIWGRAQREASRGVRKQALINF